MTDETPFVGVRDRMAPDPLKSQANPGRDQMTIQEIVERGKGTAHAWRVQQVEAESVVSGTVTICELYHYSTRMLAWVPGDPADAAVLDFSIGWGSVSDQNGMNTAFKALGLPYRFDRDRRGGGPRITELRKHDCGHVTDPSIETHCVLA